MVTTAMLAFAVPPGMVDTMNTVIDASGARLLTSVAVSFSAWNVPLALPSTNTALAVGSKLSVPPYGSVVVLAAASAKSSGALLVLVRVKGIAFPAVPGVTFTYVTGTVVSVKSMRRSTTKSAVPGMAGWATALTLWLMVAWVGTV